MGKLPEAPVLRQSISVLLVIVLFATASVLAEVWLGKITVWLVESRPETPETELNVALELLISGLLLFEGVYFVVGVCVGYGFRATGVVTVTILVFLKYVVIIFIPEVRTLSPMFVLHEILASLEGFVLHEFVSSFMAALSGGLLGLYFRTRHRAPGHAQSEA